MRRSLVLFAALAALAACGGPDSRAPFTDSRTPPGLQARFYPPDGWAWGLVRVGEKPSARYGVSAPPRRPRADVVILPGYGEPAEVWFETAKALNARGYVVWVLEGVGQGGSGRYALPRDLGYAPDLGVDVETAKALIASFVRRRPVVVLADGASAPTALRVLGAGLPVEGVILSGPTLSAPDAAKADKMRRLGLGRLRVDGAVGWRRDGTDDRALGLTHDGARGKLRLAWQTANPDLRMGGPSWGWRAAFAKEAGAAEARPAPKADPPVLMLLSDRDAATAKALCKRLPACAVQGFGPAGSELPLEVDEVRGAWLSAVTSFIEARIARFSPPPVGARLAPEG